MGAIFGVIFHAIGGFAAGSFYIPFKMVKQWKWESSWLVLGIAAWLLAPMLFAYATVPDLFEVLQAADAETKMWTFIFGALWGIGGLTFGMSMRYLGISLGMTIALGFCTAFGTLIPPIYEGLYGELGDDKKSLMELISEPAGQIILLGVLLCLVAIGIVGIAGMRKEKELDDEAKQASVAEFNLTKGLIVSVISGILSACFAFGLEAGKPIADIALTHEVKNIFQNNAVLVWILWGGIATNGIYSIFQNIKNKSFSDYTDQSTPLTKNYLWAMLGGVTWYLQFFFYGMGSTYMGEEYEFASWSIHMAFIILFSNLWGIYFKEWKGVSQKTNQILGLGLFVIMVSIVIIGMANMLVEMTGMTG